MMLSIACRSIACRSIAMEICCERHFYARLFRRSAPRSSFAHHNPRALICPAVMVMLFIGKSGVEANGTTFC